MRATMTSRGGFTLLELIVVLILLSVSAGVVLPLLRSPAREDTRGPALSVLIKEAQQSAARRGEVLRVVVARDGSWHITSSSGRRIANGTLPDASAAGITLMISPFGSCRVTSSNGLVMQRSAIDPLTCAWKKS